MLLLSILLDNEGEASKPVLMGDCSFPARNDRLCGPAATGFRTEMCNREERLVPSPGPGCAMGWFEVRSGERGLSPEGTQCSSESPPTLTRGGRSWEVSTTDMGVFSPEVSQSPSSSGHSVNSTISCTSDSFLDRARVMGANIAPPEVPRASASMPGPLLRLSTGSIGRTESHREDSDDDNCN